MFSRDGVGKVPYFRLWADECAPARLQREALAVLADAAGRCAEQDMRTPEVIAALAFLEGQLLRPALCRRFRAALETPDSCARAAAVQSALKGLERGL
jgi:hypothetical protein